VSPLRVTIIDDSVVIRQRLVALFDETPEIKVVCTAVDGRQGLDCVLEYEPDVVILDIRMPGMSGIEVMEALQKREVDAKIVVLTNFPYPAYRKRCHELGATLFFDKSTEFNAAVEALQAMKPNGK
jgi:DNA-binding NarL/FixJ family response regulator